MTGTADLGTDVVVIGGGPAGEVAAGRVADRGLDTLLVERDLVGGECSYSGCIPSKTLVRPGDVLAAARRLREPQLAPQSGGCGRQLRRAHPASHPRRRAGSPR